MTNTGFTLPGTGANNADAGTRVWATPGNVTADDAAKASTDAVGAATSQYLHATNFGFAIPAGSTIDGIVARVQRSRAGASAVTDQTIQLIVGGTRSGDNKADTITNWPTSDANVDYGSSSVLWGLTPTVAEVNGSTFGLAVRVTMAASAECSVDVVWLDIYYTPGGQPAVARMGGVKFAHSLGGGIW